MSEPAEKHAMRPPPPRRTNAGDGASLRVQTLLSTAARHSMPAMITEEGPADLDALNAAMLRAGGDSTNAGTTTPTSWEDFFDECRTVEVPERNATFNVYMAGSSGPVLYCIHGGGYTGLTWSMLTPSLKSKCRIVAADMRGHGGTTTADDADLSAQTLAADMAALWRALFDDEAAQRSVPTVVVGHSVGGAVAVWMAKLGAIKTLEGLIVIDVVEGTALASLAHMTSVLARRPTSFDSPSSAIEWALRTRTSRCASAAAVSVPSQLVENGSVWQWRTPLEKSQLYWEGWYRGLSEAFLEVACPKMLILAGTDRLDRVLTIGQMQGKFQLIVLPAAGHAVHEDEAQRTADAIANFLKRFRVGEPPMQLPKAIGVKPVLPVAAGPAFEP